MPAFCALCFSAILDNEWHRWHLVGDGQLPVAKTYRWYRGYDDDRYYYVLCPRCGVLMDVQLKIKLLAKQVFDLECIIASQERRMQQIAQSCASTGSTQ